MMNPFLHRISARISSSLTFLVSFFLFHVNSFWIELLYFLGVSFLGFLSLKASKTNTHVPPKNIDLFFTSTSATTLSSLSTVDMEVFSNTQLIFFIFMMFAGGEVFASLLGLQLTQFRMKICRNTKLLTATDGNIEIGRVSDHPTTKFRLQTGTIENNNNDNGSQFDNSNTMMKLKSIRILSLVVSCFLLVSHLAGSIAVFLYLAVIPSARRVLKGKGLNLGTFSVFTTVSSFANCGFIPTNENMVVFKRNSGLLLIVILQILMGNTFYPVCLRGTIWIVEKLTRKKEFRYILENSRELGYGHLLTGVHTAYLGITGLGFLALQLVVFCSMEWNSPATLAAGELSGYQKLVGSFFQVVNSRHAGESVFDLSAVSSAVLVLFVLMVYLPAYTSYLPIKDDKSITKKPRKDTNRDFWENMIFSQLTYVTIFTMVICITERHAMRSDPLNFSVLNVVFEVVSAYGNVGFSTGYSCARQIKPNGHCKDASYGFAGRWTNQGKIILIIVMFFGRVKKYNMRGGKAWSLQ